MLLLSIAVHLLIGYLFLGALAPSFQRELRPVYFVDLVTPPVAEPQAGRPDARPEPSSPTPAKPEPRPAPKAETKPATKPEPAPKATPKPEPKPEPKPARKISAAEEKALAEKLRGMQAKQEREDMKRALEQMMARDTRQAETVAKAPAKQASDAPVGEATGRGSEAGIAHQTWVGTHLKEEWRYSPYLAPERLDLEATFILFFDPSGKLVNYQVERPSGNEQFDQSIVRAILKLFKERSLPNPPRQPSRLEVTFNLKDLRR